MKNEKTSLSSDSRSQIVPSGNTVDAFGRQAFEKTKSHHS